MRIKHIAVRVIPAEGHRGDKYTFRAPPGRVYMEDSREKVIEHVIDYLDKKYPYWDFRIVEVGATQVNFVYAGLREGATEIAGEHEGRDREQAEQGGHGGVVDPRGAA